MKRKELYQRYGFDSITVQRAVFENYRPYVVKHLDSMLVDASEIQVDDIIKDAIVRIPQLDMECNIDVLVFDCLRKRLTELLRMGRVQPKPNRNLLNKYKEYILDDFVNAYSDEELECILSCFRRNSFNYFINRYFYFDDLIKYNNREEKAIRKLFEGKGDVRPLYLWNQWKSHAVSSEAYMYALNSIPFFFLNQISGKGDLISHPSANKYSILKTRFLVRQKSLLIIILLFILSMAVLLFQIFLSEGKLFLPNNI